MSIFEHCLWYKTLKATQVLCVQTTSFPGPLRSIGQMFETCPW